MWACQQIIVHCALHMMVAGPMSYCCGTHAKKGMRVSIMAMVGPILPLWHPFGWFQDLSTGVSVPVTYFSLLAEK